MPKTNVHIINHTHWDREWFLTSVYTSRWIPGLIDKLEQLAAANPDFRFLFDGQTLVIEDLLAIAPEYAERVRELVGNGRLLIGPYYCQPDWQLTGGELLIRNLMYGQKDTQQQGSEMKTGWLVDTFGHISQSPQIHGLFGIDSVYVWRGVPELEPYFHWQSPDDSQILTINLFGGYRNLYGVSHVPEVAAERLNAEVKKLRSFYPTPDIPLFDGYDLEDNPEDPFLFFKGMGDAAADIADGITLQESTPITFAQTLRDMQLTLPTIGGELNSGKFGAIFPGTLSARTYLKVMARDCEQQLFQLCEPLATMAWLRGRPFPAAQYEKWGRMLLQNAVHDCICGVSIDQVHEKMEYSYRQIFDGISEDLPTSLGYILQDFAPGDYVVSTNPLADTSWQVVAGDLVNAKSDGVGVWPIIERHPIYATSEPTDSFTWRNEYYEARVSPDGQIQLGTGTFGSLIVSAEHGDSYSDETGEQLGVITPTSSPVVVERSAQHCVVAFDGAWKNEAVQVNVRVKLHFDPSPLLRWTIDLDSQGTNLCVEMVFQSGHSGDIFAGMPLDIVKRPTADTDLMPRDLSGDMASVLLGQRELNKVTTFPFHDLVAVAGGGKLTAVLAKGLHAYKADEAGTLKLTLRRSVEWLTAANLENRIGDAGPFFYVPDGRCERTVRHEVAIAIGNFSPDSVALQRLNATYQNPPLIVRNEGAGTTTSWQAIQEDVPMSSLTVQDGAVLARFYNVMEEKRPLSHPYTQVDVWGEGLSQIASIPAKKIVTVQLEAAVAVDSNPANITLLTPLAWRSGSNRCLPETAVLTELKAKIVTIKTQLADINTKMADSSTAERLRLQHQYYALEREQLEFELSHLLNRRKIADNNQLNYDYLYQPDPEIAEIGLKLNHLRIKRRIFDYVVQAL